MKTREIPRDEWRSFFDGFSRQHQGERVTVEYLGTESGLHSGARCLPLLGITAEPGAQGPVIEIITGDSPEQYSTHVVHAPTRVKVAQKDDGIDGALLIQAIEEPMTVVDFRPDQLAEVQEGGGALP